MTVYDVSHYQSAATVQHALASDATTVFVKATEGTGYVDPAHDTHVEAIRRAGKRVGHYHFARSVSSAGAEAAHFLSGASVQHGDLVALDLEAMDGTWSQRVGYAVSFLSAVDHVARCFWYVNASWRSALLGNATPFQATVLMAHPLWIAAPGVPGQPGVSHWTLHQYSTSGGIDHDVVAAGVDLATFSAGYTKPVKPPVNGVPLVATDAEIAAIADEVWTRYVMPDGRNLAQAQKDTTALVEKIAAHLGITP